MAKSNKPRTKQGNLLRDRALQIVNGIVKAYYPAIGLYIVTLNGEPARCCSLNYSGGLGFGLYSKGTYSPGDSVFCIFHEALQEGFIIGSMPRDFIGREINYPISGESAIGLVQQGTARACLVGGPVSGCTNDDDPFITRDTQCNVLDSPIGGSFNMSSETGIRFFADPYSIGMQSDDATGVWVFSDDSYLRQAGVNYQGITGGKVEEDYNDNGELVETVGHSMFSWELLGRTEKPQTDKDLIEQDLTRMQGKPLGSSYRVDDNAKPFHRVVEYGGYLGHGYQRVINAPPNEAPESYVYGKENRDQYCLSRVSQFADGEVSIESAKSIILSKKCFIPSIQTMEVVDNFDGGAGDSSKESGGEYDFSHEDVKVKSSPEFNKGATTCELLQELAALMDYQNHLFNYKLVYPFVYHKKDYYVSDEMDTTLPTPKYMSWFSTLRNQQFVEMPEKHELDIHDKLKSTYYASESGLAFLPAGGVSMYGGYGEEIRMGSGTSTISAPGDIWIKAGRNIHLWAGNDIILKAKNCIDESATDGSIRIKAEKHLEMLGGNSGSEGGVLIESKSSGDFDFSESGDKVAVGGLIIRASKGTAVFEGENTYICAGIDSGVGTLTIDAGQPNGSLNLCGGFINNYLSTSYFIANGTFDSSETGQVNNVLYIRPGNSIDSPGILSTALHVFNSGNIVTTGNVMSGGSLIVRNTCSTLMDSESMVMPVPKENRDRMEVYFDTVQKRLENNVELAQGYYSILSDNLYVENKAGNADRLKYAGFSYRTEMEYGAYDFKLYADRWQNIAYALTPEGESSTLNTWEEKKVSTTNEVGQYPYPGDKFYEGDETCLVYQPCMLYNMEPYTCARRIFDGEILEEYSDPKYAEPELKSLNEYTIIGGANG